jgi:hypothetical protein
MKSIKRVLLLLMISAGLSSCEKIKNLFDVEIDTTIEGDLSFVTDENALKSTDAHGFNASTTVDVLNEDLVEYEDLIKDFKTQSITLEVLSIDSAGHDITGIVLLENTQFGISNSQNSGYTWTLTSDWPIDVGFELSLDAASYDALNDILDDLLPVTFTATGTCNTGNITISLNYGIDVAVKANPN